MQQKGHHHAADETPERCTGERQHDDHRAQSLRCIIAGQRNGSGETAGDADAGEKARSSQEGQGSGGSTRERGNAEQQHTEHQQWLAAEAVADRPGKQGAGHDANI
jgi:hypothetical protein